MRGPSLVAALMERIREEWKGRGQWIVRRRT